jgi:hypothetical protein
MDKDPAQWPQVLLTNQARFKGDQTIEGASGFLVRLPNGAVVAATARHLLGKEARLEQLDATILSWVMYPRTMPSKRIALHKLAIKPQGLGDLDSLLLTVTSMRTWPVEVLPARPTPVQEGETVYLLAVPYDQSGSQKVYQGVVQARSEARQFPYQFDGVPDGRGFSGAPIIDARGNIVGIHLGRYDHAAPGKTIGYAQDICELLPFVDLSAVPAPPPQASAPQSTGDAAKADQALDMARMYVANQQYDTARSRLQAIVDAYPNTPTARQAQALLQEIKGK